MKALIALGLVVGFIAAAGVTAAGGGVDDPAGGLCIAHGDGTGCNPNAGKLFGRCVIMVGAAYVPSSCGETRALPAAVGRAGTDLALPALAGCGQADMDAVLATIRTLESGGRYTIGPNGGGASGAYQFIRSTWNDTAARAGRPDLVGVGPWQASPADQDALARQLVAEALGGTTDVSRVPVVWYVGTIPPPLGWDVVPAPEAGNRSTPRQYQAMWLATLDRVTAPC